MSKGKSEIQGARTLDTELQQIERFKEAARALGCDEDEAAFDEKLKGIAKQKPKDAGNLTKNDS